MQAFFNDSYGNRTRVTAVKGRCLNRLTKEPLSLSSLWGAYHYTFKTAYTKLQTYQLRHWDTYDLDDPLWSSPRPISSSQLHTLLHFHLCPIYLVVFKGSYFFRMGYLILRGASRLDAFSVYPFRAWLLGHALGRTADTPAARPSRSSRTKDSSSQISYAHAG